VYVPLVFAGNSSASGAFELYLPYAPVQAAVDRESNQLYLVLAAGLTLFYASMFPVVLLATVGAGACYVKPKPLRLPTLQCSSG